MDDNPRTCIKCKREVPEHHLTGVGAFRMCIDCRYFGGPPRHECPRDCAGSDEQTCQYTRLLPHERHVRFYEPGCEQCDAEERQADAASQGVRAMMSDQLMAKDDPIDDRPLDQRPQTPQVVALRKHIDRVHGWGREKPLSEATVDELLAELELRR